MRTPSFEPRRRKELEQELLTRARAWLTDWHPRDEGDFAIALLKIAARIESEVTQRLDRAPEKAFRAFLDWLGVKGKPGLAARLPVVFTMTPGSDPVDAPARVELQVNVGDQPVSFETESALRILPGALTGLVAVDPKGDKFFLPPPGLFNLAAPAGGPDRWRLKADAPARSTTVQLDPPVGLDAGLTLRDPGGLTYRISEANGGLVTLEPPLDDALAADAVLTRVTAFTPFGPGERNDQKHELYIGSAGALNVQAEATISVQNGGFIPPDATWWYSGKRSAAAPVDWIRLETVTMKGADVELKKPSGAIETLDVGGHSSRWLKVSRASGVEKAISAPGLRLMINCLDIEDVRPVTALEGMANTTPLVLDSGFYPFGREPRQFDSFYLGSKEAFSKPAAEAALDFALGDRVSNAHAAIGSSDTDYMTLGVSDDGRLQRAAHRVSNGKPVVVFEAATQPVGTDHRPIALDHHVRPGAAAWQGTQYASASARSEVWLWNRSAATPWTSLGEPFADQEGASRNVRATLLARSGAKLMAFAAAGGKLRSCSVDDKEWKDEDISLDDTTQILTLAPVLRQSARAGEQDVDHGLLLVTDLEELWMKQKNGRWDRVAGGPARVDPAFYPAAVFKSEADRPCLVRTGDDDPDKRYPCVFNLQSNGTGDTADPLRLQGHTADFRAVGDLVLFAFVAIEGNDPARVYVWDGTAESPAKEEAAGPVLTSGPIVVGKDGPTAFFYFAGEDGEAFILPLGRVQFIEANLTDALTLSDNVTNWETADQGFPVDLDPQNPRQEIAFVEAAFTGGAPGTWVLQLKEATGSTLTNAQVRFHLGKHTDVRNGTRRGVRRLELAGDDAEAVDNGLMYVADGTGEHLLLLIDTVTPASGTKNRLVDFAAGQSLPGSNGSTLQYKCVDPAGTDRTASVKPFVDTTAVDPELAGGLASAKFESATLAPPAQAVSQVLAPEKRAVLAQAWTSGIPASPQEFSVSIDLFHQWMTFQPPKPRNPTLSWEYFDGTAWRLIPGLRDGTNNLATGGRVEFCVPRDLQPTDVVGHTNNWIRARLVGGDYGEAGVTVTTTPGDTANSTKQVVDRNLDSIRAPYVAALTVKYRVCCAVTPDLVLARDNGGLIDQTNVNRNPTAIVDYFVPLSAALSGKAGNDAAAGPSDRALFLGFDTRLTGGPIQILFLVDEGEHDQAFPLRVDALVADRFRPVLVRDNTRGLNESGTVEMDLVESPQQTELFGTSRFWLRVRPGPRMTNEQGWQPRIRAAYLNAASAVAADTQDLEPLGSSDGSPNQRFLLARPPVIEGSLRLRVLERLGDEDVERLTREGFDIAKTLPDVPERDGHWVLWKQVIDPADAAPGARVYALEDATGAITFGDGLHGMIPPIGTDVILAERYQRGGGAAANGVTAWSQINLITALPGVIAVNAPAGAAGGSDPQDADTTLRFAPANLRLRDRALTLADLETLALQFSRDIAQVRAIPTASGLRLMVAMRGRTAKPPAAVVRELRAYLLVRSSPMLAGDGVLQIEGPEEVVVRIALRLVVDDVESSGSVGRDVRARIGALLDPATGGHDNTGWPLGTLLTETDIAAALAAVPHLESLSSVSIAASDGAPLSSLKASQLVRLAPDGITITMQVPEEARA